MSISEESACPVHVNALRRSVCTMCNAAYMRAYLRRRREQDPAHELWSRARKRAARLGLSFSLPPYSIAIPAVCPALGIPLIAGGGRKPTSPSLDRIRPADGYVVGNVRVISDRANRLKSNLSLTELQERAERAPVEVRDEYAKIVRYLERELLRIKATNNFMAHKTPVGDWRHVADLLEEICQWGTAPEYGSLPHSR